MILVFGGTTEGRIATRVLDGAGKPYLYSTLGDSQKIESPYAVRKSGKLDHDALSALIEQETVRLIIDAAHPFAVNLHKVVDEAAKAVGIPVIRLERRFPERDSRIVWCDDYDDAVRCISASGVSSLLALTGVRTIPKLKSLAASCSCVFRILDRDESRLEAESYGIDSNQLVYYRPADDEGELLDSVRPDAIITKESGESGGFAAKVEAAMSRGIKVFAVKRPQLPAGFIIAEGEVTLRRAVERLMPGFFPLRSGLTTGTCATAAVVASLSMVLSNEFSGRVGVVLPGGETVELDAELEEIGPGFAVASVVKDAGDDPDVTNGAVIKARVELSSREEGDIRFYGGEGIGTVTLPGLGLEVGGPAINPVPRLMMEQAVRRLLPEGAVDITVSIPGGESLALRTFNSRVGVEGGLSIIGTSGVVRPFSNEAFAEALMREIEVAAATGCERLVMNSGAKSEKSVRSLYPELPQQAFVHYGNAIGEALQGACRSGIKRVSIGLMIGKAVKLAEGHLDTHSHKVSLNREFLASLASSVGCSESAVGKIMGMDMARDLWNTIVPVDADLFFPELLRRCLKVCAGIYGGDIEMMIIDDNGVVKYRI